MKYFILKIYFLKGLSLTQAQLPAGPGKQSNHHQQRDHGVGSQAVTGAPQQEELQHQQSQQRHRDEEGQAVAITVAVGIDVGVQLAVVVELVEPQDDQHSDDGEHDVQHVTRGLGGGRHIAAIHTIHKQHTHNADGKVDEPRVIHKARHTGRTSTHTGHEISLAHSEEVEHHCQQHQAQNQVGPQHAAAQLLLQVRQNLIHVNLNLRGSSTNGGGCCVCNLLNRRCRRHFCF